MGDGETHDNSLEWTRLSQAEAQHAMRRHDAYLRRVTGGQRALLTFHDLSKLNLSNANFAGAKLGQCHLANANLRGAIVADSDLTGADLSGADLSVAELRSANLDGTVLAE